MNKKIGIIFIVLSVVIALIAVYSKINSENIISAYFNETGTCFINGTCLHDQTNTFFTVIIIIAAVLFVIGFIFIFFDKQPKEKNKNIKPINVSLTKEQKIIYNLLKEAGTPMIQGQLVEKSGMNKVRVSRILDKMEMIGVIERKRYGMSNLVVLKSE